jgi:hypothetical protein
MADSRAPSAVPYLNAAQVPIVQNAFNTYTGFNDEEREKIGWRNAFALFPTLREKFPDLQ